MEIDDAIKVCDYLPTKRRLHAGRYSQIITKLLEQQKIKPEFFLKKNHTKF